ncbi:hypothetical protein ACJX0J_023694, partial [Zea mays]
PSSLQLVRVKLLATTACFVQIHESGKKIASLDQYSISSLKRIIFFVLFAVSV